MKRGNLLCRSATFGNMVERRVLCSTYSPVDETWEYQNQDGKNIGTEKFHRIFWRKIFALYCNQTFQKCWNYFKFKCTCYYERNQSETILWDKFIHEAHDRHGQDVAVDDELQNKHQQHFQELYGDNSLDNRNLALGEQSGETDSYTYHSRGQNQSIEYFGFPNLRLVQKWWKIKWCSPVLWDARSKNNIKNDGLEEELNDPLYHRLDQVDSLSFLSSNLPVARQKLTAKQDGPEKLECALQKLFDPWNRI